MARPRSRPPSTAISPHLSLQPFLLSLPPPFIQNATLRPRCLLPRPFSPPLRIPRLSVYPVWRKGQSGLFLRFWSRRKRVQLKSDAARSWKEISTRVRSLFSTFVVEVDSKHANFTAAQLFKSGNRAMPSCYSRDSSTRRLYALKRDYRETLNYSGSRRLIVCSTPSRQKTRRNSGRWRRVGSVLIYFPPRVS